MAFPEICCQKRDPSLIYSLIKKTNFPMVKTEILFKTLNNLFKKKEIWAFLFQIWFGNLFLTLGSGSTENAPIEPIGTF